MYVATEVLLGSGSNSESAAILAPDTHARTAAAHRLLVFQVNALTRISYIGTEQLEHVH
jgi:hypothetical protein